MFPSIVVTTPKIAIAAEFATIPRTVGVILNINLDANVEIVVHKEKRNISLIKLLSEYLKCTFTLVVFFITISLYNNQNTANNLHSN